MITVFNCIFIMVLSKFNPIILTRDFKFDVKLKEYAILNSFG